MDEPSKLKKILTIFICIFSINHFHFKNAVLHRTNRLKNYAKLTKKII